MYVESHREPNGIFGLVLGCVTLNYVEQFTKEVTVPLYSPYISATPLHVVMIDKLIFTTHWCALGGSGARVQCGDPPEVPNATRDRGSGPFPVGTVVTYTCHADFDGWGYITCQPNGQWSLQRPTCTGMVLV